MTAGRRDLDSDECSRFRFGPEDVANVRFAISPLMELHNSVRTLDHPEAKALHLPWVAATRARVARPRHLRPAGAPALPRTYTPGLPQPTASAARSATSSTELAAMLATPADQVRTEVRRVAQPLPALLQPLLEDDPRPRSPRSPIWSARTGSARSPRTGSAIRALLEGDVLYRARRLADAGAQRLFADIHPELRFADDTLFIDMPFDGHLDLEGRGLLFVPSAFTWPRPSASLEAQPFVVYPARGIASLWDPARAAPPPRWPRCWAPAARPCSAPCTPRARRPSSPARSSSPPAASPSTSPSCATPGCQRPPGRPRRPLRAVTDRRLVVA